MSRNLVDEILEHVNLPQDPIEREFMSLLEQANITAENLDLEALRRVMASYLQDVFLKAKDEFQDGIEIEITK